MVVYEMFFIIKIVTNELTSYIKHYYFKNKKILLYNKD
jgi:hypothetical protein